MNFTAKELQYLSESLSTKLAELENKLSNPSIRGQYFDISVLKTKVDVLLKFDLDDRNLNKRPQSNPSVTQSITQAPTITVTDEPPITMSPILPMNGSPISQEHTKSYDDAPESGIKETVRVVKSKK